jgi:hypothetical protein
MHPNTRKTCVATQAASMLSSRGICGTSSSGIVFITNVINVQFDGRVGIQFQFERGSPAREMVSIDTARLKYGWGITC